MTQIVIAVAVLAVGTYLMRLAGPLLADRLTIPEFGSQLLQLAAVALLAALAATAALTEAGQFVGLARPAGVLVGVLLALRRLPFALVIVGAAVTTALLRLAGIT